MAGISALVALEPFKTSTFISTFNVDKATIFADIEKPEIEIYDTQNSTFHVNKNLLWLLIYIYIYIL
jgi:hypothetical protein